MPWATVVRSCGLLSIVEADPPRSAPGRDVCHEIESQRWLQNVLPEDTRIHKYNISLSKSKAYTLLQVALGPQRALVI